MTSPLTSPAQRPRLAGLDGLRALAVGLVIAYHLIGSGPIRSGFIGVDVFFVISGFLITALLLRERDATGRIDLYAFWRRRARRLLPALAVLVTVCATWAWLIGGDVLVRLGAQVLGAATFSYNWVSIAAGSGYFAADTPELLRNLWSLAVEEQFYVLWPLLLPLFLLLPRAWMRAVAAVVLAVASATWMAVLTASGSSLDRAYFGTDSHAFGILLGICLAFVLTHAVTGSRDARAVTSRAESTSDWRIAVPAAAPVPARSRAGAWRVVSGAAGVAAVAGLLAVSVLAPTDTIATFPGQLVLASALTAIAIIAAVWPRSWFGRALDIAPLRIIGERSYGLYLWHWPIVVLLAGGAGVGAAEGGVPVFTGLVALALTIVLAELSYRFVETPVRRYGFRGVWRRVFARRSGPILRLRALGAIVVAVLVLGGTSAALAAAPGETSGEAAVAAGIAALEASPSAGVTGDDPAASPSSAPALRALDPPPPSTPPSATATTRPPEPAPTPSPTPVTGSEITAVGDSVMLASAPALIERLPGIQIDADVSRSMYAAPGILGSLAGAGQLRHYVVLALGTNGPIDEASLNAAVDIAGPDRVVILVTAYAPRSWIEGVNDELVSYAASRPGVQIADWAGAIGPQEGLLAGDRIHPGEAAGRIFAQSVADAVAASELQRAEAAFRAEVLREVEARARVG